MTTLWSFPSQRDGIFIKKTSEYLRPQRGRIVTTRLAQIILNSKKNPHTKSMVCGYKNIFLKDLRFRKSKLADYFSANV